jgi:ribose/xylose/arabinose/galactoside ABC-type transport system permease subunit
MATDQAERTPEERVVACARRDNAARRPGARWDALRERVSGGAAAAPIAFVLVSVFFTFGTSEFLTTDNITLILDQTAPVTIAACAMTMVILMGGIDLSVGSILSLASVLVAVLLRDGTGLVPAILVALAAGAAIGLLNGLVTVRWAVQPFLVTLGTLSIARGLAELVANGATVPILTEPFTNLFAAKVAGLPVAVLWTLGALVISHLALRHTVIGRQIYAIGGNEQSAIQAGVRVSRVKVIVYVLSGLLAGVAGLVVSARLSSGLPGGGVGFELDVIAAVVLGGTGFRGEGGSIIGTLFGALTIGAISNGLTLMDVDPFVQKAITGAIIIGAVVLGSTRTRR